MNIKKFLNSIYTKTAVAVLILSAVFIMLLNPGDKIASGVCADGINIGGLTKAEAVSKLEEMSLDNQIIIFTSDEHRKEITGADIELKRDLSATADAAYALGRGKNIFKNVLFLTGSAFRGHDITYQYGCNDEKLTEILYNFGVEINGELHNNIFEYSDEYVTVKKGVPGQNTDVSDVVDDVIASLTSQVYEIPVTLTVSVPKTPTADSLADMIYLPAQDASYTIQGGKITFTDEQYGREIDKSEAEQKLDTLINGGEITLKLKKLSPSVTVSDLNSQLFGYELGRYSTVYSTSNKSRSSNVELAASKINSAVLAPGDEFSYNDTVGKRTRENGFKEAQIYENGEVVQGLGGGVCQVSSTLYSAVLYADLKVTERRAHSMTVGYVPKGQDATVSYGTIDFKFKNSTNYPIKISAAAKDGKIEITILGTKPENEKTVKIINNVIETNEPEIEEVPDKTLSTGQKKVISKGKTGYKVETVRKTYENGAEVKSEKMSGSIYKATPTKVAVGAKVPDALPELPPLDIPQTDTQADTAEIETEGE